MFFFLSWAKINRIQLSEPLIADGSTTGILLAFPPELHELEQPGDVEI